MSKNTASLSDAEIRFEQAMVDADIEGMARDSEAEALVGQWRRDGVSVEDQIERLKHFYRERSSASVK